MYKRQDKTKRGWCQRVVDVLEPDSEACIYDDITKISSGTAQCQRHGQCCPVEAQIDGLVVGFSCKDASKANPNRGKLAAKLLTGAPSPGKTNDTIASTLELIENKLPEWILLENSDTLDDADHAAGLELLLSELAGRGYDPMPFLIDGSEYGLPQVRKRMYILAVLRPSRRFKIANYTVLHTRIAELLLHFKVSSPSLLDTLLPNGHPCVDEELALRQTKGPPKLMESSTIDIHRKEFMKAGLRWGAAQASPADQKSPWWKTVHGRQRDILAFNQHTNKTPSHSFRLHGVDLGQSIGRAPTTVLNREGLVISPTILPGSMIWISHSGFHRPVLGVESLMFQGWPIFHPRWSEHLDIYRRDNTTLQSLAGNAFPGTVIIAIMAAFVFALDFDASGDEQTGANPEEVYTTDAAATSAMDLLNRSNT